MIKVENGLFFGTESEFERNGYIGKVFPDDGTIRVERVRGDKGVLGFIYPSGGFIFNNRGVIKSGKIPLDENGKINGTFGLHTSMREKYLYFRNKEFQDFLDKHGITAVKHEDPNRVYTGFNNHSGWGDAEFYVETDGVVDREDYDRRDEDWREGRNGCNPNLWSDDTVITVSDATYAIEHVSENYRDNHNNSVILHTLKNVMELDIK